jgi:hypothetical protein
MTDQMELECVVWTTDESLRVETGFTPHRNIALYRFTVLNAMLNLNCLNGSGRCQFQVGRGEEHDRWDRIKRILLADIGAQKPLETIAAVNMILAEITAETGRVWDEWDCHVFEEHEVNVQTQTLTSPRHEFNEWLRSNTHLIDMVELVAAMVTEQTDG